MTREEAKTRLIAMKAKFEMLLSMRRLEISDVFDVAIKALEQETEIKEAYSKGYKDGQEALAFHLELCKEEAESCEDAISRAELLKAIDTWDKFGCDANTKLVPYQDYYVPYIHYYDVVNCIKGMPSVTPKVSECEDAISRKAAIDSIERMKPYQQDADDIMEMIQNLPPVTSQPKIGRWGFLDECTNSGYYCSECHKKLVKEGWSDTVKKIKFCPNCGAKMAESEG